MCGPTRTRVKAQLAPAGTAHLPAVGAEGEAAPPAAHGAAATGLPGPRPPRDHLGNARPARRPGSGRPRPRSSCPAAAQKGPLVRAALAGPAGGAAGGRHPLPCPMEPRARRIRSPSPRGGKHSGLGQEWNPGSQWSAPCAGTCEPPKGLRMRSKVKVDCPGPWPWRTANAQ